MRINHEIFVVQYPILKDFVCHLAYYRILFRHYRDEQIQSDFWTRTIDAHLLRAVMDWCMVFGTDDNETHWKKLVAANPERLIAEFRQFLASEADLPPETWQDYWAKMLAFRNDYAAHRTLEEPLCAPPCFDTALGAVFAYDRWLRNGMEDAVIEEPLLKASYEAIMSGAERPLLELMQASATHPPNYALGKSPAHPIFTTTTTSTTTPG